MFRLVLLVFVCWMLVVARADVPAALSKMQELRTDIEQSCRRLDSARTAHPSLNADVRARLLSQCKTVELRMLELTDRVEAAKLTARMKKERYNERVALRGDPRRVWDELQ